MFLIADNTGQLPARSWRGRRARGVLIAGIVRRVGEARSVVVRKLTRSLTARVMPSVDAASGMPRYQS